METIIRSTRIFSQSWLKVTVSLAAFIMLLAFQSCQKSESDLDMQGPVNLKSDGVTSGMSIYFDHKIFNRGTGMPFTETVTISNPDFGCYENFTLLIKNGQDKKTRVSSAEIRIDGVLIAGPSDFSKNVLVITKPLSGLNSESTLEVKLNSAPGSYIDLWIEATSLLVTPVFTQIGPVVQDSEPPVLPTISENGISGTWSPETINTDTKGFFTYMFTPDAGQCATSATMIIEITNRGSVADVQGNIYQTVKIGGQWWMAENLKTTMYNNGDLIGTTTPADLPIAESTPKYQWAYKGIESRVATYGRLYTWYAVTDSRGVCPVGWHVPSDMEWTTLTDYLTNNGYGYEGSGDDVAKSLAATSAWLPEDPIPGNVGNDLASNNSTGFTALPGGERLSGGQFTNMEYLGRWWSSDASLTRTLYRNSSLVYRTSSNNKIGASVRCIKD
jgi:uncharacterized protein (TIGR02145 family)